MRAAVLRVEDMEFPEGLKKYNLEAPGINKKRSEIFRHDQKKIVWNFHEFWFLALEIPICFTRYGGISRGEASFCLESPRVK